MVTDDVLTYLENHNIVSGTTGWTATKDWVPDQPDKLVSVVQTSGRETEVGPDIMYPTFQVRVRGEASAIGYDAVKAKIHTIHRVLHGFANGTINGTQYNYIIAQSDIMSMGRDSANRPEFSLNFRTSIQGDYEGKQYAVDNDGNYALDSDGNLALA